MNEMRASKPNQNRSEQGTALMVTMLVLALVAIVGLASMETVTRDRQVAGYQSRSRVALYADNPGDWMFHCHVLEHQAAGMMGIIRVG